MIRAINKQGTVSEFTERVWGLMSKNHNGYIELNENEQPVNIPDKIIEFQVKKKQEVVKVAETADIEQPETEIATEVPAEISVETMKKFLTSKGIKFHQALGYTKLKKLYDDNSK